MTLAAFLVQTATELEGTRPWVDELSTAKAVPALDSLFAGLAFRSTTLTRMISKQ
jgi:hypothetical protein